MIEGYSALQSAKNFFDLSMMSCIKLCIVALMTV